MRLGPKAQTGRRHLALTLGLVVGACGLLTFAAVASAHHAKTKPASKHKLCSAFLSTSTVDGNTGVSSSPVQNASGGFVVGDVYFGGGDGRKQIVGSTCQWAPTTVPDIFTSYNIGDWDAGAELGVGYGETASGWSKLVSWFQAGAPDGFPAGFTASDDPTYSPLIPPTGMKAFLVTLNMGAYYGYTPSEYATTFPGYSPYLYVVTVLTPRHDVIQVWFGGATAAVTEGWAFNTAETDSKSI